MTRYEADFEIDGIVGAVLRTGGGGLNACLGGIKDAIESHERGDLFDNSAYAGKPFARIVINPIMESE